MPKKSNHIPVNTLPSGTREGIIIFRTSCNGPPDVKEVGRPHRDNGHLFILQEKGTTHIEIDFEKHSIEESSVIYINPDQIHHLIGFENATFTSWIITSENLQQENLKLLADLTPVSALILNQETLSIISATAALCIQFSERKHEKLFNSILKESCNTLVTLVASQYLSEAKTTNNYSRFEGDYQIIQIFISASFYEDKKPNGICSTAEHIYSVSE